MISTQLPVFVSRGYESTPTKPIRRVQIGRVVAPRIAKSPPLKVQSTEEKPTTPIGKTVKKPSLGKEGASIKKLTPKLQLKKKKAGEEGEKTEENAETKKKLSLKLGKSKIGAKKALPIKKGATKVSRVNIPDFDLSEFMETAKKTKKWESRKIDFGVLKRLPCAFSTFLEEVQETIQGPDDHISIWLLCVNLFTRISNAGNRTAPHSNTLQPILSVVGDLVECGEYPVFFAMLMCELGRRFPVIMFNIDQHTSLYEKQLDKTRERQEKQRGLGTGSKHDTVVDDPFEQRAIAIGSFIGLLLAHLSDNEIALKELCRFVWRFSAFADAEARKEVNSTVNHMFLFFSYVLKYGGGTLKKVYGKSFSGWIARLQQVADLLEEKGGDKGRLLAVLEGLT
ncbi:hypothetical protein PCE1_001727 [Barthelona sp. PCE]